MRKIVFFLAIVMIAALPAAVHAWDAYVDPTTGLPGAPWTAWGSGNAEIADTFDGGFAIRVSSGADYKEYTIDNHQKPVAVAGAMFSLESFSATGTEDILCLIAGFPPSPSISIALSDGHFWVRDYTHYTNIVDLGPASIHEWHTAYIRAAGITGVATVIWDGAVVFDAVPATIGTGSTSGGGWIEWGSGSWSCDASTAVDFAWVGFGGPNDFPTVPTVPEPASMLALGAGLLGLAGTIRRRK